MKRILLELDEATAKDLYAALFQLGEHIAAGAPLPAPSTAASRHLESILERIAAELGWKTPSTAMHDALQTGALTMEHTMDTNEEDGGSTGIQ
jgi:hypothetical protein